MAPEVNPQPAKDTINVNKAIWKVFEEINPIDLRNIVQNTQRKPQDILWQKSLSFAIFSDVKYYVNRFYSHL